MYVLTGQYRRASDTHGLLVRIFGPHFLQRYTLENLKDIADDAQQDLYRDEDREHYPPGSALLEVKQRKRDADPNERYRWYPDEFGCEEKVVRLDSARLRCFFRGASQAICRGCDNERPLQYCKSLPKILMIVELR